MPLLLSAFTEEIASLFLDGKIKAPIHLSKGNEEQLIEVFKSIKQEDWLFSTYRSHYHALLKGLDPEWLKGQILSGHSMHINNAEHRFFTSSIVGGCLPIALGVAMGIKMRGGTEKVWVFVGDMAAETGMFHECTKYAKGHNLPVTFVVEDNGFSVDTPTQEVWGNLRNVQVYKYTRQYPHVGCGQWKTF